MRCGHGAGRHGGPDCPVHNPHLQVTGFDLPEVGPIFEEYVGTTGLNGRLKFAPGSFFTDPLPKADVIMMGHILHDWDLATKRMLIGKAYDALPKGGAYSCTTRSSTTTAARMRLD